MFNVPAQKRDSPGFLGQGTRAALAANYSQLQLWNPTGNNVYLLVDKITITATAADFFNLVISAAALATFIGTALSKNTETAFSGFNNDEGEIRGGHTAVVPVAGATANTYTTVRAGAAGTLTIPFEEPMIIGADNGLIIIKGTVNTAIESCSFYFRAAPRV